MASTGSRHLQLPPQLSGGIISLGQEPFPGNKHDLPFRETGKELLDREQPFIFGTCISLLRL